MDFNLGNALGSIFGGLFGNSDEPFERAQEQYQQYGERARQNQMPFYNAGTQAIPAYQNWLNTQKDPGQFINNLMGQYQESPYARYLQQQSLRAGQNAASANGLSGSTPLMQQLQQNAGNISSQDLNQWLSHALGINTQYGQGQGNLMQGGQNSANQLSNLNYNMGQNMADMAYGESAGRNFDRSNILGGLGTIIGMFA